MWRVSELRSLDGIKLREAVKPNGALERLVGKGKAGELWGQVVRMVAQVRGGREDAMGRRVRTGAGSRCSKPLDAWKRSRRQLWKVEETTVKVQMSLEKVWDDSAERWRVGKGRVWPVEASCVMVDGEERWVLDELPAELSEQAYMWQWEQGVDGSDEQRQEWQCSGWRPGVQEKQLGTVEWIGSPWEQQGTEEGFAVGAEQQLLGEGHSSMRDDRKWQSKLAQARVDDAWGTLDVYSDGGADGAGTPAASAEYG